MHVPMNSLQNLLVVSILGVIAVHASFESLGPCTLQAWVRAPDLAPGAIVQGDARLKLTVGCTTVESAVLGLRFKERSFAKASRSIEATRRPARPDIAIDPFDPERISPASPWALPSHDTINCSAAISYAEIVKEKSLWSIREEERIVFESTRQIELEKQPGAVLDVVQHFAILVPLTNFPPAWDYSRSLPNQRNEEFVNVETIYEYFVRVVFENGSIAEIPAGFTAFQPLYDPPSEDQPSFRTVRLQTTEPGPVGAENDPIANYTVDVFSTPDAFAFLQGSDQSILVLVNRRGRARKFDEPLTLNMCLDASIASKWASEHTSDPTLQPVHKPNQLLRATSADFKSSSSTKETKSSSRCGSKLTTPGGVLHPHSFWMPNATDAQIEAGAIVSTTAHAFSFPVRVDPRQSTDFETYYHTLVGTLRLLLGVPRAEDESGDDMAQVHAWRDWVRGSAAVEMEPDEDAWVPWQRVPEVKPWRGMHTYSGEAPVRVYPPRDAWVSPRCVRASSGRDAAGILDSQPPEQVRIGMVLGSEKKGADAPGVETECALPSPVHYLSDGARAPVFVDADDASLRKLRARTAAERDALAPHLSPVVVFPPDGEERVHRYYRTPKDARPPIYVGETWVKKVTHVDEHKVTKQRPDSMRDAMAKWQAAIKYVFDEL